MFRCLRLWTAHISFQYIKFRNNKQLVNYIPAINNKQASITAAPVNIVAIKISCPGQSTKLTCLNNCISLSHFAHLNLSSLSLLNDLYPSGSLHYLF